MSSLLTTLLATAGVIPLPLGAAHSFPLQVQHPSHCLVQNADTSHGTPKTLTADKQLPLFNAAHFAPPPHRPNEWLNPSTTSGTPKVATADKQPPVFVLPHQAPHPRGQLNWLPDDTSSGTAKELIADKQPPIFVGEYFAQVQHPARERLNPDTSLGSPAPTRPIVTTPPFVPAPSFAPFRFWWQPLDGSSGTSKTLTADKQAPFVVLQQTAPHIVRSLADTLESTPAEAPYPLPPGLSVQLSPLYCWWQPADTTQDMPATLRPLAVTVATRAPTYAAVAYHWQQQDTSLGQPDTLRAVVAPPPVVVAPSFAPHRVWQQSDTSLGSAKALTGDKQAPFSVAQVFAPDRSRPVADTTQDTPAALLVLPQPPGAATWIGPSRFWWQPSDTSYGTAKAITQDAQPPTFVAPQFAPSAKPVAGWLPADTTLRQPTTLQVIVPPPPIVVAPHIPPLRFWWQPADSSTSSAKTLYGDAVAPLVNRPYPTPDALRPVTDTTQKQPITLQAIVPPPPVFLAPQFVVQRFWWQPSDTSLGTPKTAIADRQLPFAVLQQIAPDRVRSVSDTTQDTPTGLLAIPLPPGQGIQQVLSERPWFIWDTTQDTPVPLLAIPLPPGAIAQVTLPDRFRQVAADTSASTAKALYRDATLPRFNPPQPVLDRIRPVTDTSQGTSGTRFPTALPPGQTFQLGPVKFFWQPPDTSSGTPKSATADKQAPIFVAPHFAPIGKDAKWIALDTSVSENPTLYVPIMLVTDSDFIVGGQRGRFVIDADGRVFFVAGGQRGRFIAG